MESNLSEEVTITRQSTKRCDCSDSGESLNETSCGLRDVGIAQTLGRLERHFMLMRCHFGKAMPVVVTVTLADCEALRLVRLVGGLGRDFLRMRCHFGKVVSVVAICTLTDCEALRLVRLVGGLGRDLLRMRCHFGKVVSVVAICTLTDYETITQTLGKP